MKNFIIHDGLKVLNRIISEKKIPVEIGCTCIEAVGEWDGMIGQEINEGKLVPRPVTTQEELDILEAERTRQEEIKTELTDNILNNKEFSDIGPYVDSQFASAATLAAIKTVIKNMFKLTFRLILAIAKKQGLSL